MVIREREDVVLDLDVDLSGLAAGDVASRPRSR